jgi:hypothetical protein
MRDGIKLNVAALKKPDFFGERKKSEIERTQGRLPKTEVRTFSHYSKKNKGILKDLFRKK